MTLQTIKNFPSHSSYIPSPGAVTNRLGLYIHLPFCEKKCDYCAFVSAIPESGKEMDLYTEAILKHLSLSFPLIQGMPLSTIFLGGGTPTLMGAKRLANILKHIYANMDICHDCEITIEANPESVTLELIQSLHEYGVNRISLGAQSFDTQELKTLGRIHTTERIHQAFEMIRKSGIDNINLDLIFAIPGQTVTSWQTNLNIALQCNPTHLSTYGLSYEEGTHLSRRLHEQHITPVLEESYLEMYDTLLDSIKSAGWKHYEISNACKPGHECRHNLLYWNQDNYLSLGVSAHGYIQGTRYGITSSSKRYVNALLQKPHDSFFDPNWLSEMNRLSTDEIASDVMIFGLRKREGINIVDFKNRFEFTPWDKWGSAIDKLIRQGWLKLDNNHLHLTKISLLISNEIFEYFLEPEE